MIPFILISFGLGIFLGAILESTYRSKNARKFIKPKIVDVQMYGFTTAFLAFLYLTQLSLVYKLVLIFIFPTAIEFITGYLCLKLKGARPWDYSLEPYNFMGIIRLRFSIYWFILSLAFYYYILPYLR